LKPTKNTFFYNLMHLHMFICQTHAIPYKSTCTPALIFI
jgi:hypothetical protein